MLTESKGIMQSDMSFALDLARLFEGTSLGVLPLIWLAGRQDLGVINFSFDFSYILRHVTDALHYLIITLKITRTS